MTIIVYFHASHYRDFKHYYTEWLFAKFEANV
jgi:hypothetical protein